MLLLLLLLLLDLWLFFIFFLIWLYYGRLFNVNLNFDWILYFEDFISNAYKKILVSYFCLFLVFFIILIIFYYLFFICLTLSVSNWNVIFPFIFINFSELCNFFSFTSSDFISHMHTHIHAHTHLYKLTLNECRPYI